MKSGLEGRNNKLGIRGCQLECCVSMKSGLEGRNNPRGYCFGREPQNCLNEVRPSGVAFK